MGIVIVLILFGAFCASLPYLLGFAGQTKEEYDRTHPRKLSSEELEMSKPSQWLIDETIKGAAAMREERHRKKEYWSPSAGRWIKPGDRDWNAADYEAAVAPWRNEHEQQPAGCARHDNQTRPFATRLAGSRVCFT